MALESALSTVHQLKEALELEVKEAQGERELLRRLDSIAIAKRATARQAFNARADSLRDQLSDALQAAARSWGTEDLTWQSILRHQPREGAALRSAVDEVAALASALKELDGLHRTLVERTLVCLRSYNRRVHPHGSAYDRRGASTSSASHTTRYRGVSSHG